MRLIKKISIRRPGYFILVMIALLDLSCSTTKTNNMTTSQNDDLLFPKGKKLKEYFSGDAYQNPLRPRDENNDFALGNVLFEPGARTFWHTHPKGQTLIVTAGQGFYQEKGKPAQVIKKGDVIKIPENVEHWHGASSKTLMAHIAITNFNGEENVTWLQPVSEEEYSEVNKK